jgi:hypothetical protein
MTVYRHADLRFPFLWESADQPPARWNAPGDGPVQYFADTPDGAWAEFLRHEGISQEAELEGIRRSMWAIDLPDDPAPETPHLSRSVLAGGAESYEACQKEARRLRAKGARSLRAPSAALTAGGARGWKVDGGLQTAAGRDGFALAVFGPRPDLVGWAVALAGRPRADLLARVRHL